jgi:tetratricopeptide (TPR) repeat protein
MKVAVYTIALNEEAFVERWAESAKDADYLFILDTGSTDSTIKKAKKSGVNISQVSIKPWRFDDARNAALALLPDDIDYCIALDMDEVLLPNWRQELEKMHEQKVTRPRYTYTWSWQDEAEKKPGLQYGGDKIHLRHGYRWKHPVHEVIVTDRIEEVQGWCGLEIHHHPDSTKSRGQYFPLLKQAIIEDPHDDRNAFYYARELFFYGEYLEAAKEFKRHLSLPKAIWKPERAASYRYLAKCEQVNAREHLTQAIGEDPSRREPLVELALHAYHNKIWEDCYKYSIQALAIQEKPMDYLCEDFAWGALPYDLAALSSHHLGMHQSAVELGTKAVELDQSDDRLKANLKFYIESID